MQFPVVLSLLIPSLTKGAETISKSINFPPPTPFRNASRSSCSAEEDEQCAIDDGVLMSRFDEVHHANALEPGRVDYSNEQFGVLQKLDGANFDEAAKFIEHWRSYMINVVMGDSSYSEVRDRCRNQHELCSFWAMIGECDNNPSYMKTNCAPSCLSCDSLDFNKRCPVDESMKNAFEPGDVDRFFERVISSEEFAKYNITVHSRPKRPDDDDFVKDGPWLITFEDFITPDEADRLIQLGELEGYKRSTDVGHLKADGSYTEEIHSTRTSTNSWCLDKCMQDPVAQDIVNRIEQVTLIPQTNSESLQMLRYDEGQYYGVHHDLIEEQANRPPGVRILTFYMYLNGNEDSGLEGGGTRFPKVGVTVTPKKGRAAMWSSVLNDHPHIKDPRTDHTALPVTKGVKFGANAWIHQRDFMTPNIMGCT